MGWNYQESWQPIWCYGKWTDRSQTDNLLMWVLLPSGCEGDVTVDVVDKGNAVEIGVLWPRMMLSADDLHYALGNHNLPENHPKLIACDGCLKKFFRTNRHIGSCQKQESKPLLWYKLS